MGKADFKKINDHWCGEDEIHNRAALNKFYDNEDKPSTWKKKGRMKSKKSDHKHKYEKCFIKYKDINHYCLGRYCLICNKLILDRFHLTEKTENGTYRVLSDKEILQLPEYKNLPIIKKENLF